MIDIWVSRKDIAKCNSCAEQAEYEVIVRQYGTGQNYTYNANNRLTNEATSVNNDIKSAIRYYYDSNGNTTAEQRSTKRTVSLIADCSFCIRCTF